MKALIIIIIDNTLNHYNHLKRITTRYYNLLSGL